MHDKLDRFSALGVGSTRSIPGGNSSVRSYTPGSRVNSLGRSATASMRHSSLSMPRPEPEANNSDHDPFSSSDDRSKTPPANGTRRVGEVSPRQRLVSEPTSPHKLSLLRKGLSSISRGSRRGGDGDLEPVLESARRSPTAPKKARTPIPFEFMASGDQRVGFVISY